MSDSSTVSAPPRPGLVAALREMVRPKAAEIEKDVDFVTPGAAALGRDAGAFDATRMARFDAFTRAMVAAVAVATLVGAWAKGMTLVLGDAWAAFQIAAFMAVVALLYSRYRPAPRLAAAATMMTEQMIYGVLFIFYSYVAVSYGGAERAPLLSQIDQALGFDWAGYKALLESNPRFLAVVHQCYASILIQNMALPAALIVFGRLGWARVFMNCYALGAALNITVAMLVPAIDAQAYYVLHALEHLTPTTGVAITDDYIALRDGALTTLDFAKLTGIVSFPSFHTYLGLLYSFCVWPFRRLRWAMIPVNALMIVATPKFGLHFLVDVIGGAVLAGILLTGAYRYLRVAPSGRI
jgi:membrane-associated phospholipid phosphatase